MVSSKSNYLCSGMKRCCKHLIGILGVAIAIISLWQVNAHFQWQNFNDLNLRYANLISTMPEKISDKGSGSFESLEEQQKLWVRYYFNLTSEEYYLYKRCLIPGEMWKNRIVPGVKLNMATFPMIISGFRYWKERGAFNHPSDFITVMEKMIAEIEHKNNQSVK